MQSILKFKTLDEVIERANATTYGLAAGILTHNLENALVFSNAVEAGSVWVNCFLGKSERVIERKAKMNKIELFPRLTVFLSISLLRFVILCAVSTLSCYSTNTGSYSLLFSHFSQSVFHILFSLLNLHKNEFQFGGYKQSGLGRECGEDGLELYQETKTVSINLPINH